MISDVQRIPATSVDPTAKNYHWNDLTMGLFGALDAGADSVLLVDAAGNVVEGPGFNVFCVREGVLITPGEGMLEGVSRRTVIEMAHSLGLALQVRTLPASELRGADEVFITTSGGGVLPVTVLDKCTIGSGSPGPITRQLVQTYWAWHADPAYSRAIDYTL
jgi:branched-chain amino acid aminotransferase